MSRARRPGTGVTHPQPGQAALPAEAEISAVATADEARASAIAAAVIDWQRCHGRHGLPWQGTRDPYRVWLSEIMLQQTQVATVLAYYPRFLQRFPDVQALAAAPLDDVLGLWSGLGYYSRARNLHRCASVVVEQHGGRFPATAEQLAELPGIGRSTAAAIAAFCWGERVAILDGNVKRVLSRVLAFGGDIADTAQERALWRLATDLLPRDAQEMPAYTQGLMDLGAGVCSVRNPQCLLCPLRERCQARSTGKVADFPVKSRRLVRGRREHWWLWLERGRAGEGAVWLEQRPHTGVWAGLWTLPLFEDELSLVQAARLAAGEAAAQGVVALPTVRHALTHFDWVLHPRRLGGLPSGHTGLERPGRWFAAVELATLGLPAPLRKLLVPAR